MLCFPYKNPSWRWDFKPPRAGGLRFVVLMLGLCSVHAPIMLGFYGRIVLLLAAAFDGFFAKILNLHFLRKFRRIRAFSDLGLLLLVCLLWWGQWVCHIFVTLLNSRMHFWWQVQYLVILPCASVQSWFVRYYGWHCPPNLLVDGTGFFFHVCLHLFCVSWFVVFCDVPGRRKTFGTFCMLLIVRGRRNRYITFCIPARNGLDVSCVTTTKHECPNSIVFCIPYVRPRNGLDVSCVRTRKHEFHCVLHFTS